jgi:anthranilate synthase/aminodeoxychorismate synthase-like glutamine amidotransferase
MTILLLDNFDSFTYMLKDYIEQCDVECIVYRNNEITLDELSKIQFDGIVISPGPLSPNFAGISLDLIHHYHSTKPILGVCLGHQAIAQYFGSKIVKAKLPRHGKVDKMIHSNQRLFANIPNEFSATRYHSLIAEDLPDCLIVNCKCKDEIMGIQHKDLPLFGIQFHPESCQTEQGLTIIKNFIEIASESSKN